MKLSDLKTIDCYDQPQFCQWTHPATGAPLFTDKGEPVGINIAHISCKKSRAFLNGNNGKGVTDGQWFASFSTGNDTGLSDADGKPIFANAEGLDLIFAATPEFRAQTLAHVEAVRNFFGKPSA
jgi:hypothetical protein